MQPLNPDYGPVRAAIARGDLAAVEAQARKLRDEHIAKLVRRAATRTRSYIRKLVGHAGSPKLDLTSL